MLGDLRVFCVHGENTHMLTVAEYPPGKYHVHDHVDIDVKMANIQNKENNIWFSLGNGQCVMEFEGDERRN